LADTINDHHRRFLGLWISPLVSRRVQRIGFTSHWERRSA